MYFPPPWEKYRGSKVITHSISWWAWLRWRVVELDDLNGSFTKPGCLKQPLSHRLFLLRKPECLDLLTTKFLLFRLFFFFTDLHTRRFYSVNIIWRQSTFGYTSFLLNYDEHSSLSEDITWDFLGSPVAKTSMFPMQGAQVRSLVRKLGPTCCSWDFRCHN